MYILTVSQSVALEKNILKEFFLYFTSFNFDLLICPQYMYWFRGHSLNNLDAILCMYGDITSCSIVVLERTYSLQHSKHYLAPIISFPMRIVG